MSASRPRRAFVATCLDGVPVEAPQALPDDAVGLAREADALDLAARVAADEAMHWGMVNAALGRPPPGAALSFGA